MTAAATALRVLSWAAEPEGAPPTGPLWDLAELTSPPGPLVDAAAQLARRTAARLGAGFPPFGGRNQIGPGLIFLAAAVGGRLHPGPAARLALAVPPAAPRRSPGSWYDLIARHSLAGPATAVLSGPESDRSASPARAPEDERPLGELLLEASPLTTVLYRPTLAALRSDTTRQAASTAVALLSAPRGQAVLAAGLAGWSPLPPVLTWRASLLARLRLNHPDLLLDVYLLARTRFADEWDNRIAWAGRQLLGTRGAVDPLALATLRFWAPLAALERAAGAPLSALRPLLSGQDRALHLVRTLRLDQAGAA